MAQYNKVTKFIVQFNTGTNGKRENFRQAIDNCKNYGTINFSYNVSYILSIPYVITLGKPSVILEDNI